MNTPEQHKQAQTERLPSEFSAFSSADINFKIDDLIGIEGLKLNSNGNFGTLLKATYKGKPVIIKTIKFEEGNAHYGYVELALLKNIHEQHNHLTKYVLGYLGAGKMDGELVMINEYLERGDVKFALKPDIQFFKKEIHPSDLDFVWKQRMRVATQISEALKCLHDLNIIHRDIKTENLFLSGRGRRTIIKLGDFGMARGIHSIDEVEPRTYTICGTDELMAPEMLMSMPYDHSVDIYSFGLVIAELICGKGPSPIYGEEKEIDRFLKRSAQESFDVDLTEISRFALAGCPLELIELCKQCLSYEPKYRISAEDLSDMMKDLNIELNKKQAERVKPKVQPKMWIFDARRGSYRASTANTYDINNVKSLFDIVHAEGTPQEMKETLTKHLAVDLARSRIDDSNITRNSNKPAYAARRNLRNINRKLERAAALKEEAANSNLSRKKPPTKDDSFDARSRAATVTSQATQKTVGRRVLALQQRLARGNVNNSGTNSNLTRKKYKKMI